MNEKIRALAELAEVWTIEDGQDKCEVDVEKFAELIAKEILNISDEVITIGDGPEWLICERLGINHDWRRQDNFWGS